MNRPPIHRANVSSSTEETKRDVRIRLVMPEGSNRVFSSLSTNTFSRHAVLQAPGKWSAPVHPITPESVEPSFDILMNTFARPAIVIHPDGDISFVPAHAELVRH